MAIIKIDGNEYDLFPVVDMNKVFEYYAAETIFNGVKFTMRLLPDSIGNWKIYHPSYIPDGLREVEPQLHKEIVASGFSVS